MCLDSFCRVGSIDRTLDPKGSYGRKHSFGAGTYALPVKQHCRTGILNHTITIPSDWDLNAMIRNKIDLKYQHYELTRLR